MRPSTTEAAKATMKYHFFESHGLRSPLTAIRWACGRLKKSADAKLSPEEKHLLNHIYSNTKLLTSALEAMLMLAKTEDKLYKPVAQDICLRDLLSVILEKYGSPDLVHWNISSPHLHARADREILETILRNIFIVLGEQAEHEKAVSIEVAQRDQSFEISFSSSLELPVLLPSDDQNAGQPDIRLVGGIPGLMLSMANALSQQLKGSVELEAVITGEFIEDGTVELDNRLADEYRIVLKIPTKVWLMEGDCQPRSRS